MTPYRSFTPYHELWLSRRLTPEPARIDWLTVCTWLVAVALGVATWYTLAVLLFTL